jgi:hypothetical protein
VLAAEMTTMQRRDGGEKQLWSLDGQRIGRKVGIGWALSRDVPCACGTPLLGDCPGNARQHWLEASIVPINASLSTRNNCDCLVALCCRGFGRKTRQGTYRR